MHLGKQFCKFNCFVVDFCSTGFRIFYIIFCFLFFNTFKYFSFKKFYVCGCLAWIYACIPCMCSACGDQKRSLNVCCWPFSWIFKHINHNFQFETGFPSVDITGFKISLFDLTFFVAEITCQTLDILELLFNRYQTLLIFESRSADWLTVG